MENIGNTGIIPLTYSFDVDRSWGSTYLRVTQLTTNYPEFEQYVHGKKYDNLISQYFCWEEMMERFTGPKIWDLCDPNWIANGLDIMKPVSFVHAITCASNELTQLVKSYFPDKIVEHVPDRLDFKTFPPPRAPHQGKAQKALWFGYIYKAYDILPQLLPSIKETGLQLHIISNQPYSKEDEVQEAITEFTIYDRSKVYEQIKEADILLNPNSCRAYYRYRSNNKSLIGWQLGLPVAITNEDVIRLLNPDERNKEVAAMRPVVAQEYQIGKSAEQYRDIIHRIRQRYF